MKPKIYFASDHAGFLLKNELILYVKNELLYEVIDSGAYIYDENDDFTGYIADASKKVSESNGNALAIILGGSGQGEAMLANRFPHVRAVVYYGGSEEIITLSRLHNNANVLSLGARFINVAEAKSAIALWLETKHVPMERYDRRIDAIESIPKIYTALQQVRVYNHTHDITIVPSLPATSFSEIQTLITTVGEIADGIQIDIVDGVFVPHVSWPFTELQVTEQLLQLKPYAEKYTLEIDCMCMNPETYLNTFVLCGIARVIIHEGTTSAYVRCIAHAHTHGYKIGLGILNTTPLSFLEMYVKDIDFVQVMGIAHIGIQGQDFDMRTLETVAQIHTLYPDLEIAVDGAVNKDTILELLKAGTTRFAPGSAVTSSTDMVASYKQLKTLIDA